MIRNKDRLIAYIPAALWLFASIKLLVKASTVVHDHTNSLLFLFLLAMGAWYLAALKHRLVFVKSIALQTELNEQLFAKTITRRTYLRKTFFSKKFFILLGMVSLSLLIKNYITNVATLFFIRSTIGYTLLKASLTLMKSIHNTSNKPA